MTPTVACSAILFALLGGDAARGGLPTSSITTASVSIAATVDVPAPTWFSDGPDAARSGGQATRNEVDSASRNRELSAWYRLAYIDGGSRLRVFEHYAATTEHPDPDVVESVDTAWHFANTVLGAPTSDQPPTWAQIHTGVEKGSSAGLIYALTYLDLLTPGMLVGDLRVAGTGSLGSDGVVIPVSGVEVKVAAAVLARPNVVFTPTPSALTNDVTIVQSQHTRIPDAGSTVAEWLNLSEYERAGRQAAQHTEHVAFVVVHDIRQALAWLCGRTGRELTCTVALQAASIPIGTP